MSGSFSFLSLSARDMQCGSQFMRFWQLRTMKGAPCRNCCCARLQSNVIS